MRLAPTLFACLLIALTLVTGVGQALARGAMAADGQLCSVTGPAPVVLAHDGLPLFDADGEPVTLDRDDCLDCLLSALDLPRAAQVPTPAAVAREMLRPEISVWMPVGASPGGLARAPPTVA